MRVVRRPQPSNRLEPLVPLLLRTSTPAATATSLLTSVAERVGPEQLALGRAGVGVVMIARPRAVPGLLGVDSATSSRMSWSTAMLGAREIALGLGTLAALRDGDRRAADRWTAAGLLCDAVDALAVGTAVLRGRVPAAAGAVTVTVAVSAVLIALRELSDGSDGLL